MLRVIKLNLIFLLLFSYKINAQEISVTGKILDKETLSPITNASLIAYKDNTIMYRTVSDSTGIFKIPGTVLKQSNFIRIHALSYRNLEIDETKWINNKQNFSRTFYLIPEKITLKEVVVKSSKRYRDTTNIDLSKQKFERSVMIDDLFSSYGFSRGSNGQLYYKGKPIADLEVNGGTFFGKNNVDIYHLLPALILDKIVVTETNIDSVTNTNTLQPILKVNLMFKDKYRSGKFGIANLGIGTAHRYLANSNLYTYENKEQASLLLNSNNINNSADIMLEPRVDFLSNGDKLTTNSARFTYRNVYADKVELNFSLKGQLKNKNFKSESDLQEENTNLSSKTLRHLKTKILGINDTKLDINYKIDTLNTIKAIETFDRSGTKEFDSLNYNITLNNQNTSSQLNKLRSDNTNSLNTKIIWEKKLNSKKGRLLSSGLELSNKKYDIAEFDNVYNVSNLAANKYFIDGKRSATENKYAIYSNFTEPVDEASYFTFSIAYEKDKLNYNTQVNSDTVLINSDAPSTFSSNYFKPGISFQKTLSKISLDGIITGILDIRNTGQAGINNTMHFFNFNIALKADYRMDKKKGLLFDYSETANYPGPQQLTNLNNTFDLIAQTNGNIYLKPEEKKTIRLSYSTRPLDSEFISIAGEFSHYTNKFGYKINNLINVIGANITTDNIGNANSAQISLSVLKNIFADKYLNYSSNVLYQELPTFFNNKFALNNGVTINQSLSTSIRVIDSLFTIAPNIQFSYSKFFYENSFNVVSLTYSDKLSFKIAAFQLDLYPLINYNHSIGNTESFSMNGAIRKGVFKGYGEIWLQAYDIFNSFKYIDNFVGPLTRQTVKYANLTRYMLVGINFKLNNMK